MSEVTVTSLHITVCRFGRNGFQGQVTVINSDNTTNVLVKEWRNKTLTSVKGEVDKLLKKFIAGGVSKDKVVVEYK